jgi:hypothetical protein
MSLYSAINLSLKCHIRKNIYKVVGKGKIDILNTQLHDCSLCWIGTRNSIKSDRVKLVLWAQISPLVEMMQPYKCFLHVSKMPTL